MEKKYYPWGGEYTTYKDNSPVAVVLLNIEYTPPNTIAIYGPLKTENIGIEKIVANIISNPNIRYLIICGDDIKGHRSGSSLISLHKNGIDNKNKIINAPGAIPYIENLKKGALNRFKKQIQIIDLLGIKDKKIIDKHIDKINIKSTKPYGKPYIAIRIKPLFKENLEDKRALHSKIIIDYMGVVQKRGK